MHRKIVYPGVLPQDTDILQPQRNTLMAIGQLMEALLGSGTWISGLGCIPGAGLNVVVQPGQIYTSGALDANAFGSLAMDAHTTMRQGALRDAATFSVPAPGVVGRSINYLIQIRFLEVDADALVLPYYNSANPAAPLSGPANSGTAQNTSRSATCDVQILAGVAATTGTQTTPVVGAGYTGLAVVTVSYGNVAILSNQIVPHGSAPRNIAKALLAHIVTVDGVGSGLDADSFQGKVPSAFRKKFRGAMIFGDEGATSGGTVNYAFISYDTDNIRDPANHSRLIVPAGVTKIRLSAAIDIGPTAVWSVSFLRNGIIEVGVPGLYGSFMAQSTPIINGRITIQSPIMPVVAGQYYEVNAPSSGYSHPDYACYFEMEVIDSND